MSTETDNKAKLRHELSYWCGRKRAEGKLKNIHFEALMLAMAKENSQDFLKGKVVVDFGCGPRGSLEWATEARLRIGVDVLADDYIRTCGSKEHNMVYVCSTESSIPLPSNYADVLFTMNAFDHVANTAVMARELMRILAPGGQFIASFNLYEPKTVHEPNTLTSGQLHGLFGDYLESWEPRTVPKGPGNDSYRYFFCGSDKVPKDRQGKPHVMWLRGTKRQAGDFEHRF